MEIRPTFNFKESCHKESTQIVANLESIKCFIFIIHKIYCRSGYQKECLNICKVFPICCLQHVFFWCFSQFQPRALWTKQTIQLSGLRSLRGSMLLALRIKSNSLGFSQHNAAKNRKAVVLTARKQSSLSYNFVTT